MESPKISLDQCYIPSHDIVSREIDGEIVIVPLTAGIGDLADDLYALNVTGKAIWQLLDGNTTLAQIVTVLCGKYEAQRKVIERDVIGMMEELLARNIITTRAE